MITNITLENFKCFRKVEVNPKLVTLFIGPNGTGKSGVLQALLLLKQSRNAREQLELDGPLVCVSSDDLALQSSSQQSTTGFPPSLYGGLLPSPGQRPTRVHLSLQGKPVNSASTNRPLWRFRVSLMYSVDGSPVDDQNYLIGYSTSQPDYESLVEIMQYMRAVPAERGLAKETYVLGPEYLDDIPLTGGLGEQEDGLVSTLVYSQTDVSQISEWMERVTGVGVRTDMVPPQSVMPLSITPSGEFFLVSEGFGTNALIQLLFELARAVEGATILMEEPEIHLHPRAQAELASVIVEEAKASNKQVIMTTHSEHIAGRLLTLVAEKTLPPDDVAIYSFEKDPETGVCSASEIEVTERGQVMGGLTGFFEADMDEVRRYADALRSQE